MSGEAHTGAARWLKARGWLYQPLEDRWVKADRPETRMSGLIVDEMTNLYGLVGFTRIVVAVEAGKSAWTSAEARAVAEGRAP